ncbi:MAG: hypothetical protein ABJB02_08080 [Dokdonella sp.]
MKHYRLIPVVAVLMAALAGCNGSSNSSSGGGTPPPPPPPPPPPTTTSFTSFVHTLLAQTSDTSQPADVNGVTFTIDDNPADFTDVVGTP